MWGMVKIEGRGAERIRVLWMEKVKGCCEERTGE